MNKTKLDAFEETKESISDALRRETTERQLAEERIRILGSAVHNVHDGVIITTPATGRGPRVVFANSGFARLTGLDPAAALGRSLKVLRLLPTERSTMDALLKSLRALQPFRGETTAQRLDGSEYALEINLYPVHDDVTRKLTHWVGILRDVSERRMQVAELRHQALHDALTGLPNRTLLHDRLDQAIRSAKRSETQLAFLIMDLDRFREVNDTFGHSWGDRILQELGARLKAQVREADTVGRIGGDEFAVLLPDIHSAEDAEGVARKLLSALEKPFNVDGHAFDVTGSIGISFFPGHGENAEAILQHADIAMYVAKEQRVGYSVYSPERDRHRPGHLELMLQLREAIRDNQLVLYFQPKAHLQTGLITRVEALVRWRHPLRGLLPPAEFIPMAERTGLVKPLTDWVLEDALRQCSLWHGEGLPLGVAVNLSTRSLQETFLIELVTSLLKKWDIAPWSLKLELTESGILADPPGVMAILRTLQSRGIGLSLDDFGTGYSSLTHLRQLPVDEIKIDKSFVMEMTSNRQDYEIVRAMIDLAHNLGRQVVAEGVEDAETLAALKALGCDLVQGYYLSPPIPAPELVDWLHRSRWGLNLVPRPDVTAA